MTHPLEIKAPATLPAGKAVVSILPHYAASVLLMCQCLASFSVSTLSAEEIATCCVDLEERVRILTSSVPNSRHLEIEISGQLHRSVLFWSDGAEKNSYIVDPTSGGSFFSFAGDTDLNEQWEAGFLLEIDTTSNKSDELSQNGASSAMAINLGSAKFFFSRSELGSVSLGKQTEAHDHITEFDLSGTDDFAGPAVSDWNGDFLLRHSPARRNLASQFTWAVFGADDIGDGAEASVIRLDTPDERKVQASFSWGMGGVSAVALRFAESLGDFDVMGGAAFAYYADDARSPCRDDDDDLAGCGTLGGSLSVKHKPSAISFTAAYGLTVIKPSDAPGQSYWSYGKLARAWPLLRLGPTTTYAEYFHGVRNIPIELDELAVGAGGTGDVEAVTNVIGIGVMQNLEDFEIDFYLALRRYEIEAEVHGLRPSSIPLESFEAIMAGSRITF